MSDQFDGLGLPRRFVATHPRRVRWHSRHRDPDGVRSLLKQGNQRSNRDMTLHNVAIDQSGMTYANAQQARQDLILFGARPILHAMQERLSMDDVMARGRHVEFALDEYIDEFTDPEIMPAVPSPAVERNETDAAV